MKKKLEDTKSSKRSTIHDVARRAGVSAATVSKVLRGVETVQTQNAQAVHRAVAELGYRMDPLASGLRGEKRAIIGAIVPDLESSFFGALVTGLEQAAEQAGYHMIVASSRESEEREADLIARMDDWRVAGTILVPVRSEQGLGAQQLRSRNMRAVLVDRVDADATYDTISADNYNASAQVAEFLYDAGHRHILIHGATYISAALRTRVAGFTDRANALGPDLKIDSLMSNVPTDEQRQEIRTYFSNRSAQMRPTAIFSLSQRSTLLFLSELRRMGIGVPSDISLVGFDDAEWMQTTWPSITVVAQPVEEMARAAVETLLSRVQGGNDVPPVCRREPCTLCVRESALPKPQIKIHK